MAPISRIKRRLVRDLVRQNIDLVEGRGPRRRQRYSRRARMLGWTALAVLAIPAGILASGIAIAGDGVTLPGWRAGTQAAPDGAGRLATAGAEPTAETASGALPPSPLVPAPGAPGADDPLSDEELAAVIEPEMLSIAARSGAMLPDVLPLTVRRVVVDPGHGGAAIGTSAPHGVVEKEVALDIGLRLRGALEQSGFEVVMTREADTAVSLQERAQIANEQRGDLFVSIHINWIEDRQERGVETYYLGASDDPYINQLAAAENRDSGYSLADMRHLLDRIYSGVRVSKSQNLAEAVQDELYRSLRKINPELTDRGVKRAPFVVLVDTRMPAILAEVSCLSNEREAKLLQKPLYRQFIAEALAKGVRSYSGVASSIAQKGQ